MVTKWQDRVWDVGYDGEKEPGESPTVHRARILDEIRDDALRVAAQSESSATRHLAAMVAVLAAMLAEDAERATQAETT